MSLLQNCYAALAEFILISEIFRSHLSESGDIFLFWNWLTVCLSRSESMWRNCLVNFENVGIGTLKLWYVIYMYLWEYIYIVIHWIMILNYKYISVVLLHVRSFVTYSWLCYMIERSWNEVSIFIYIVKNLEFPKKQKKKTEFKTKNSWHIYL